MNSADTADQMMKMTLEGIQVAAEIAMKAGGATARSLAATLYAILTDRKKIKGRTRLDSMLKSGKELKVFAIRHSDLKKFCQEAKHYGVLYSVLKEKNNTDGIVDIMVRSEDASKISRIVDKFDLATIDTKAIRESVMAQKKQLPDVKPLSDQEHDDLIQKMMNEANPSKARTNSCTPFEQSSKTSRTEKPKSNSVEKENSPISERVSVRAQLKTIKEKQTSRTKTHTHRKQKTKGR